MPARRKWPVIQDPETVVDGEALIYDEASDTYVGGTAGGGGNVDGFQQASDPGTPTIIPALWYDTDDTGQPSMTAAGLTTARARRSSGNITLTGAGGAYQDIDNTLDLTIPARVGDVLLVQISGLAAASSAQGLGIDAFTIVGGSPVNAISGLSASDAGFLWVGATEDAFTGGVQYTVQSGDISSGNVTLRMRATKTNANNRVIYATTGTGAPALHWSVVNLGSPARRGYEEGTAFPAGVPSGTKFYRTDLSGGMLFRYDGTRWVSDHIYEWITGFDALTVSGSRSTPPWLPVSSDIWLVDWRATLLIAGTNNGSNYWTVRFDRRTTANAASDISTFTTAAMTASTWTPVSSITVGSVHVSATYPIISVYADKTGTPAALYGGVLIRYQLIAT